MPEGDGASSTGAETASMVPNQIAALVPTFDPAKDDLQVYSQKVMLLLDAWPAGKYTELTTRLILNCSGSAFMKLQLHQSELMENERKSVKRLVEILGGHWGQIGLEKRYEHAERALYRCVQKTDESADSFLARADIMWTELNSKNMNLSDLQAYVTLRGSTLSSDDKKKVLVDADSAGTGELSVQRVSSAIRMLGAGFFQDVTGVKRAKQKTYDQATLLAEADDGEVHDEVYAAEGEGMNEDDLVEVLMQEGDTDATFITDFENSATDLIQGDEELAAAFNTYSEARRRLSEKVRFRGFWPVSAGGKYKGSQKGRVKGKFQKGHSSSRKSLEQRILTSRCRLCNKLGHWKAECPERNSRSSQPSATAPTSFASADSSLPMEFLHLPEAGGETIDEPQTQEAVVYVTDNLDIRGKLRVSLKNVQSKESKLCFRPPIMPRSEIIGKAAAESLSDATAMFATHSSLGVVDLGATKTVIRSDLVAELISSLHPSIRKKLQRCPCHITFRFGNHGTLQSEQALVVPLHDLLLKIAIVPGSTPFLLSNTLLRAMQAVIDVEKHVLWSKKYQQEYPLRLTSKGLFLIDLNDLAATTAVIPKGMPPAETHVADSEPPKPSAEISNQEDSTQKHGHEVSDDQGSSGVSGNTMETRVVGEADGKKPSGKESHPMPFQPVQESSNSVAVRVSPPDTSMSSLSQRLQKLQVKVVEPLPDVAKYSMQELDQMKVEFGTKHFGRTFSDVWNTDQQWIAWFVKHYQASTKGVHRLMMQYIELKVERAELEGEVISVQEPSPQLHQKPPTVVSGKPCPSLMAKAKARPEAHTEVDGLTDWDFDVEEMIQAQPDYQSLADRMGSLESAVQSIVSHLEQMARHQVPVSAAEPSLQ